MIDRDDGHLLAPQLEDTGRVAGDGPRKIDHCDEPARHIDLGPDLDLDRREEDGDCILGRVLLLLVRSRVSR